MNKNEGIKSNLTFVEAYKLLKKSRRRGKYEKNSNIKF